jgi:hypothetical protein
MRNKSLVYISLITLIIFFLLAFVACRPVKKASGKYQRFDPERAYSDIHFQLSLGPRIPGTIGHERVLVWMDEQLTLAGWEVNRQEVLMNEITITNLIAEKGVGTPRILIGAHYDTRIIADQDPVSSLRKLPVPGANDGASGVAVLLELARVLPEDLNLSLQLVFFDAEDNGGIEGWDWILGSKGYVENMSIQPDAVIIVDMVGDQDLTIYKEYNSDQVLLNQIWEQANRLGYGMVFQEEYKHSMLDDHTPFVEAEIPAVDIIDFDYPYWHTTSDTADKVSPESLQVVGDTLYSWLLTLD